MLHPASACVFLSAACLLPAQDAAPVKPRDPKPKNVAAELQAAVQKAFDDTGLPGASVAVALDGKLIWEAGFGSTLDGSDAPAHKVTKDTLFQAASISKPITAMAVLRLVAAGKLELDAPVDDLLGEWKLDYRIKTEERATLRRILSHSAGITVHGFPGYSPDEGLPNLTVVLNGSGNTDPIEVDLVPGTRFRYSGGGYCVLQQMLMTQCDDTFVKVMAEHALKPLGMIRSTYSQPLPRQLRPDAARAHQQVGTPYEQPWFVHPEQAAAGLWTTAGDLCRAMITIDEALRGTEGAVLPKELANDMLTPQKNAAQSGLGWRVRRTSSGIMFGHGGSNQGFKCDASYHTGRRMGIAVMINSDDFRAVKRLQGVVAKVLGG